MHPNDHREGQQKNQVEFAAIAPLSLVHNMRHTANVFIVDFNVRRPNQKLFAGICTAEFDGFENVLRS